MALDDVTNTAPPERICGESAAICSMGTMLFTQNTCSSDSFGVFFKHGNAVADISGVKLYAVQPACFLHDRHETIQGFAVGNIV